MLVFAFLGGVHLFGGNQTCLHLFKSGDKTIDELTDAALAELHPGREVPDVCVRGKLLRGITSKEILYMQDGVVRPFPNAATFMKMQFEFSDVIAIEDWLLERIPVGEPMRRLSGDSWGHTWGTSWGDHSRSTTDKRKRRRLQQRR